MSVGIHVGVRRAGGVKERFLHQQVLHGAAVDHGALITAGDALAGSAGLVKIGLAHRRGVHGRALVFVGDGSILLFIIAHGLPIRIVIGGAGDLPIAVALVFVSGIPFTIDSPNSKLFLCGHTAFDVINNGYLLTRLFLCMIKVGRLRETVIKFRVKRKKIYMEYNPKELKNTQCIEFQILKVVDEFCKKNSIQYSLAYGTLIGAVRHQGFIPWDDDIDLMMRRDMYDRFIKLWQKDPPGGYYLQNDDTELGYPNNFLKIRKEKTTFIQSEKKGACSR